MDGIELLRLLREHVSIDLLHVFVRVNPIEPRRIETKNLALGFHCHIDAELRFQVLWHLKGREFLDQPLGLPDSIIAAEEYLIGANPEEQIRHRLGEVARAWMDERQYHRQACIHITLLGGDPAEILQAWQARVLDDKGQLSEMRSSVIYISHIESVTVQRIDRRPFVNMDVSNAELGALLQEDIRFRIGELPAFRTAPPFSSIQLDAFDIPFAFLAAQVL